MTSVSFAERIAELHEAMDRAGIEHGFGGAVALAYYVLEPRATRDIDVNVRIDTGRGEVVLHALPDGIEAEAGTDPVEVIRETGQVRLWWEGPAGIPVDLFFPQHEFHDLVARDTHLVPFLDIEIPIISATHLMVFKALFNRTRDWPDIEAMLEAGAGDAGDALDWIGRLVGEESEPYARLALLVRGA